MIQFLYCEENNEPINSVLKLLTKLNWPIGRLSSALYKLPRSVDEYDEEGKEGTIYSFRLKYVEHKRDIQLLVSLKMPNSFEPVLRWTTFDELKANSAALTTEDALLAQFYS